MDLRQSKFAATMQQYDQLDPEVREQLRAWDINFEYMLWFQVCCFHSDNKTRLEMYRRFYNKMMEEDMKRRASKSR